MPHLSGKSEADIAASDDEVREHIDPEFPPTSAALFMDPEHPPATAPAGADWSRVHGHLYVPDKKLVSILPVRYHAVCIQFQDGILNCSGVAHGCHLCCRVHFETDGSLAQSHVLDAGQTFYSTCLYLMSLLTKGSTHSSSINMVAGTKL